MTETISSKYKVDKIQYKSSHQRQMEKVIGFCKLDGSDWVRGFVGKEICRVCQKERLADGTKCGNCGCYQNTQAGRTWGV